MRALLALTLASCLLAPSDGVAGSRRSRTRAPVPVKTEAPAGGVVALRAPAPEQILVRAGSFRMGSNDVEIAHAAMLCKREPGGEDDENCEPHERWSTFARRSLPTYFSMEEAAHDVWLDDFWIDRTEVTVERYRRCVSAGRCTEPPYSAGAERFNQPNFPVILVSHNDATGFCEWAGGRLPTEAEWERAAKGAAGRRYPWGNVFNPTLANHGKLAADDLFAGDGFLEIAPVGSFRDGRTPDQIDDLAGNVEEWVADWLADKYPAASAVNPTGPEGGELRVVRGGSYMRGRPWLRAAARMGESPSARRPYIGFRCVRGA